MNGYMYVWLSPFAIHLRLLLIGHTPIPNSQFIPPPFPFGNHKFVCEVCDRLVLFFFFNFKKFIYIKNNYGFLAALGLCCFVWTSHCEGFSYCAAQALGTRASEVAAHELSSCGVLLLCSMQNLPGPGIEPMSPALGRQILIHCTTREIPLSLSKKVILKCLSSISAFTPF